jgi:uncharacterized cupredoxin-like copper-binding protein
MKLLNAILAAGLVAFISTGASAHGDESHAKKQAVPVKKEQKAWGIAGDAKGARTIEITMRDDMRFSPEAVEVKQGETIRFVVKNAGKVMHEMVIGTKKDLDEHAALMAKYPGMEHDEPYMTHVAPGKSGEIIWTFNRAGEFDFGCLIAGHYQAGMVGKIKVTGGVKEDAHGNSHKH